MLRCWSEPVAGPPVGPGQTVAYQVMAPRCAASLPVLQIVMAAGHRPTREGQHSELTIYRRSTWQEVLARRPVRSVEQLMTASGTGDAEQAGQRVHLPAKVGGQVVRVLRASTARTRSRGRVVRAGQGSGRPATRGAAT